MSVASPASKSAAGASSSSSPGSPIGSSPGDGGSRVLGSAAHFHVEDNVPGFVQSMVRDFLRQRGFEGTLRAFDFELKNPPEAQIKLRRQQEIDAHDARDFWRVDVETGGSAGAPRVRCVHVSFSQIMWDVRQQNSGVCESQAVILGALSAS